VSAAAALAIVPSHIAWSKTTPICLIGSGSSAPSGIVMALTTGAA
jgi:hypothetical protein